MSFRVLFQVLYTPIWAGEDFFFFSPEIEIFLPQESADASEGIA